MNRKTIIAAVTLFALQSNAMDKKEEMGKKTIFMQQSGKYHQPAPTPGQPQLGDIVRAQKGEPVISPEYEANKRKLAYQKFVQEVQSGVRDLPLGAKLAEEFNKWYYGQK